MADYLNYVLSNPDLRENAEALGLTQAEMKQWGQTHWENHGSKEGADGQGRQNSPTETVWESGFTETLGEQHYQGRDPNEVLQRSVRSFYQGADADDYDMWENREGIDAGWNLGQYNSAGWNMAADNPYGTGILGNTIAVDEGVGQLFDTSDNIFLQDRYEDDSIANDFLPDWTTDGAWTGPEGLGDYWTALSGASRNPAGDLRSNIPRPGAGWNPLVPVDPSGGILGGPPNPTVPSFGFPGYQDWTRFMPTNFGLAEGGGMHYQPWLGGQPTGGPIGSYPTGGPILSYPPGGGGGGPGVTYNPPTGFTPPGTGSNEGTTGNIVTDTSGNKWVMTPGGQWVSATSDYGLGLTGGGRLHPDPNFYDSSGAFIGSEGRTGSGNYNAGGQELDQHGDVLDTGVAWQNVPFLGDLIRESGWNINPVYDGWQNPISGEVNPATGQPFRQTAAPGYDYTMTAADLGLPNTTSPVSTQPFSPVSVTPNIDYGPHISQISPNIPGYYTGTVDPGLLSEDIEISQGPEGGYGGQTEAGRDYGGGYHGR